MPEAKSAAAAPTKPAAVETTNTLAKPAPALSATHEQPDISPATPPRADNPGATKKPEAKEAKAAGEGEGEGEGKEGEGKGGGGLQKRFGELTEELREAREKLAARERADAEAAAAAAAAEARRIAQQADTPPKREDFDADPDGEEAYRDARAEWRARKAVREELAAKEEAEAKAKAEKQKQDDKARADKAADAWKKQITAAKEQHDDFDEVIQGCEEPMTNAMAFALGHHKMGAELWYWLAQHPAEVARIRELPVEEQPLEIGALGQRVAAELRKTSKTPKPVDPVRGSSSSTEASLNDLAEANDMEGYAAKRQAQINEERKRGRLPH